LFEQDTEMLFRPYYAKSFTQTTFRAWNPLLSLVKVQSVSSAVYYDHYAVTLHITRF